MASRLFLVMCIKHWLTCVDKSSVAVEYKLSVIQIYMECQQSVLSSVRSNICMLYNWQILNSESNVVRVPYLLVFFIYY